MSLAKEPPGRADLARKRAITFQAGSHKDGSGTGSGSLLASQQVKQHVTEDFADPLPIPPPYVVGLPRSFAPKIRNNCCRQLLISHQPAHQYPKRLRVCHSPPPQLLGSSCPPQDKLIKSIDAR